MKSIVTGLVLSACICGLAYFLYIPKLKEQTHQEGYDKGYSIGLEKGMLDGTAAGKEAQKKYTDSMATALQQIDTPKTVAQPVRHKEKVNYNINFRVVGNQIVDDKPTPVEPQGN